MHVIYAEFAKDILSVRDNGVERNITVSSNFTRRAPQCDFTQNSLFVGVSECTEGIETTGCSIPDDTVSADIPPVPDCLGYAGVSLDRLTDVPPPCITASNAASISSESHLLSTTRKASPHANYNATVNRPGSPRKASNRCTDTDRVKCKVLRPG